MKFIRVLLLATVILLSISSVQATKVVLMNFDGDPSFPSITFQENTAGLGIFFGSAFGLAGSQTSIVKANILTLVQADFAPYDVEFITDTSLAHDYTWGIDDTAYVWTDGPPWPIVDPYISCPVGHTCYRLYGKAGNGVGAQDQWGNSIYYPTYARTWSGSFALGPGSAAPSIPSLNGHSTDHISQALANSAAHEMGHLFGLSDAASSNSHTNLMYAEMESLESTHNKVFSASDQAILMAFLGPKTTPVDTDGDGVIDSVDNCPTIYNPNQLDSNGNGIGDACESIPGIPEFPSAVLPATMIIGFLGVVLLIQRTREQ